MSTAWSVIARIAVAFTVILVLSLGLCGYSLATNKTQNLAGAALVGMVIGAGGLVLTGVAAIIAAIVSATRGGAPPPPRPPLPPPHP